MLDALQDDTPKPTNKDVYIHETPSATFYVSQYGGFSMDDITVTKHVSPDACSKPSWEGDAWLMHGTLGL